MIRALTVDDVQAYREIRLETLLAEPDYFGSVHETEASWPAAAFQATLATDRVFGACKGETIVGVVRLRGFQGPKERHKAGLYGVFVQPAWRGRGLGSSMVSTAIEAARATHERLVLTVAAENDAAITMYRKLGFITFGVEKRARKFEGRYFDVMSMALQLTEAGGTP